MKKLVVALTVALTGCGFLTPQAESEIGKGSAVILCSLERLEIDDPELNKICDALLSQATPTQRAAAAHAVASARSAKKACTP